MSDDTATIELIDNEIEQRLTEEGIKHPGKCLAVCDAMTTGLSMREAAKRAGIKHNTFLDCVVRSQTLSDQYTRARKLLIDVRVDQMLAPIDYDDFRGADGRIDNGAVQLYKAQQDNQKWAFSKIDPKRFGDKLELYGDSDNPIVIQRIERVIVGKPDTNLIDCDDSNADIV